MTLTKITEIKIAGNWFERVHIILDTAKIERDNIENITIYYDNESYETIVNIRETVKELKVGI